MLASMSVDYYFRLEQGRERNHTSQMLSALSSLAGWTATERLFSSGSLD